MRHSQGRIFGLRRGGDGRPSGASTIMAGLGREDTLATLESYLNLGIRAFVLPGSLLREPELLAELCSAARRKAASLEAGSLLLALGGWDKPGAALPSLPELPSPLALAAAGERRFARLAGFHLGHLASSCGIDLVFSPRLDLATDPKAIGGIVETFGEDPLLVSSMALAWARGLESGGLAPCGLAFPGCGSLSPDLRLGPPTLSFGTERLEDAELFPFYKAARHRLPAILVGRVYVPAFEPERIPAARSSLVVEGRLRSSLGFKGLAIGDVVDEDPEGAARAAVLGAIAGCDLTLALAPEAVLKSAEALEAATRSGELAALRLACALARVTALLGHLPSPMKRTGLAVPGVGVLASAFANRVAHRALSPLKGEVGDYTSLGPDLDVLVFLPPESSPDAEETVPILAALEGARARVLPADPSYAQVEAFIEEYGHHKDRRALVFSYNAHLKPAQESLIHVVEESRASMALIALKDPYDAAFFPRARAIAAAYGFSAASVRAVLDLSQGGAKGQGPSKAPGICPVAVLGLEV